MESVNASIISTYGFYMVDRWWLFLYSYFFLGGFIWSEKIVIKNERKRDMVTTVSQFKKKNPVIPAK